MSQKTTENRLPSPIVGDASFIDPKRGGDLAALEARLGVELGGRSVELEKMSAPERIAWALDQFKPQLALTSSFGAQSAVSLHMMTEQWPEVPVILVDTGYLFKETYAFIDQLAARLSLNLRVYRSELSPAWQEARFGKLWENGLEGIEEYNRMNKIEPMNRALDELGINAWITGLRRSQSNSRKDLPVLAMANGRLKIHPLVDWSDRDVFDYLVKHDLPYHPLWEEGYISIGDWHTSHKLTDGMTAEEARFFGLKRECGLHDGADYVI